MCEREKERERESHLGEGWTEIRRRSRPSRKNDWSNNQETTFYIENLPDGISNNLLWKSFGSVGRLSDAYVAKKKDSAGNKFGFLRFLNVRDFDEILRKANEVKILEAVVKVTLARFDRNHKKIIHPPTASITLQRTAWVPRAPGSNQDRRWESNKFYHGGKSFSEIVKNSESVKPQLKSIRIQGEGGLLQKHWVGKTAIGEIKNIRVLQDIYCFLTSKGLQEVGCSYLGGLKVMFSFHDRKKAVEFVKDGKETWSLVCDTVSIWNGEFVPIERIAKLNMRGVPIPLKEDDTFNTIGGNFGRVVEESKFSWSNPDVETGSCLVLVNRWERIDEVVSIIWKEQKFEVKVSEDDGTWRPSFSSNNLEEGEIRQDSQENRSQSGQMAEGVRLGGEEIG